MHYLQEQLIVVEYFVLVEMVALLLTLFAVALKKKNCYITILAK